MLEKTTTSNYSYSTIHRIIIIIGPSLNSTIIGRVSIIVAPRPIITTHHNNKIINLRLSRRSVR